MASGLKISQEEASGLLETTTDVLIESFRKKNSVTFHKLGHFKVKTTKSRKAYSPVLDKHFMTPPRQVLDFQPSNQLKEKAKTVRPK